MPFFAVKIGRKVGVFDNWIECEKQIKDYPRAHYKSFTLKEDAEIFISKGIATIFPCQKRKISESEKDAALEEYHARKKIKLLDATPVRREPIKVSRKPKITPRPPTTLQQPKIQQPKPQIQPAPKKKNVEMVILDAGPKYEPVVKKVRLLINNVIHELVIENDSTVRETNLIINNNQPALTAKPFKYKKLTFENGYPQIQLIGETLEYPKKEGEARQKTKISNTVNNTTEQTETFDPELINGGKLNVYCDGSAINKRNCKEPAISAGFGIFFGSNHEKNLSENVPSGCKQDSNNAELFAIYKTLEILKEIKAVQQFNEIVIHSDSTSAIGICADLKNKFEKTMEKRGNGLSDMDKRVMRSIGKDLSQYPFIGLKHVKAHTARTDVHSNGNREADHLARKSTQRLKSNSTKRK
jgi:ribonuclease HI